MSHGIGFLEQRRSYRQQLCAAVLKLIRLMIPIVLGNALGVVADRCSLAFVGHWDYADRSHYAGATLGKMYSNMTGLSVGLGATMGLTTFCAQAYGAGQAAQLNPVFLWRCLALLMGFSVFTLVAALFCEPILLSLGQPAAVAHTASRFVLVHSLGVPFYWVSSAMRMCLNSAKQTSPGLLTQISGAIAQVLFSALFTHPGVSSLGYLGVALGRSLAGPVALATLMIHIRCLNLQDIVWHLQLDAPRVLQGDAIKSYMKVSAPSAFTFWSEWWAFELLSILVGRLPNAVVNLEAHGTMYGIIVMFYMIWTGASHATCTLVGNAIGACQNKDIRPLLHAAFGVSAATSLVVALGYEACKDIVASAFTADPLVQAAISTNSLGVALSVPFYAQLMTFYGALRAADKQSAGIVGTFVGYYVVGLPIGCLFGNIWGWPRPLTGVWLGNVVALAIAAAWVCRAVFCKINWHEVRRKTSEDTRAAVDVSMVESPEALPGSAQQDQRQGD